MREQRPISDEKRDNLYQIHGILESNIDDVHRYISELDLTRFESKELEKLIDKCYYAISDLYDELRYS